MIFTYYCDAWILLLNTMQNSVDKNKIAVFNVVSHATQLDGDNRFFDAYKQYLLALKLIIQSLLDDTHDNYISVSANTKHFVKMSLQCMERIENLLNESNSLSALRHRNIKSESDDQSSRLSLETTVDHMVLDIVSSDQNICNPSTLSVPVSIPQRPRPASFTLESVDKPQPSPLELAYQKNQRLISMHRKKVDRLRNSGKKNVYYTESDLRLSLQRQMAENIAVAKQQQRIMDKQKLEKQKKFEADVKRKLASMKGSSELEQEQCRFVMQVENFDNESTSITKIKQILALTPTNVTATYQLIDVIFRSETHPLTKRLHHLQTELTDNIQYYIQKCIQDRPVCHSNSTEHLIGSIECQSSTDRSDGESLEYSRIVDALSLDDDSNKMSVKIEWMKRKEQWKQQFVVETTELLSRLYNDFTLCYKQLCASDIYQQLQELFLVPRWADIIDLFRLFLWEKHIAFTRLSDGELLSAADFGIDPQILLHSQSPGGTLFSSAAAKLKELISVNSLAAKRDCIVDVPKLICQEVTDQYRQMNTTPPGIGADELMPMITYVVQMSRSPELLIQCDALLEFIPEYLLMGEVGYCLSSLNAAINCLFTLNG